MDFVKFLETAFGMLASFTEFQCQGTDSFGFL